MSNVCTLGSSAAWLLSEVWRAAESWSEDRLPDDLFC